MSGITVVPVSLVVIGHFYDDDEMNAHTDVGYFSFLLPHLQTL
jgi:hypothetical protein